MGNNPFRYSDFLGDTLIPTGEGVDKFKNITDNGTGGYYRTKILDNGAVIFDPTGKDGKMSDEQNAFYTRMNAVFTDKKKVKIEFVESDPSIITGSYANEKIDMGDVDKFAGGAIMTPYSMLAHEVIEQQGKQKKHLNYKSAHQLGVDAEAPITGYTRHADYEIHNFVDDVDGPSGVVVFKYSKNNETVRVVLRISNGNIVNVIENAK
jgi:hypothetical protein